MAKTPKTKGFNIISETVGSENSNTQKQAKPITSLTVKPSKCRGKLIHKSIKPLPNNIQILFYDVSEKEKHVVISVTNTDSQGNFSIDYPSAIYTEVIALTSISPSEQLPVVLNEEGTFPEFLWLVLENSDIISTIEDDCGCKGTATPFLPDMEDLLADKSYAQDIGGACTNFTTPNRAIEEFCYYMVVRTSDPDLLETDPDKIKERIKEIDEKIKRLDDEIKGFKPDNKKLDFHKYNIEYSAVLPTKNLEEILINAVKPGQGRG